MNITSETKLCINQDFKVEAGPGAGKTQFLVNHINNVLKNEDKLGCTRKIACITYTNTAVETILKRLGKGIANKVEVSTIHSFLYSNVVKPYSSFIPIEYGVYISKVKGHDEPFVNYRYVSNWIESGNFGGLKHPNTKNQLLKMPVLNKALQNWLLSMKCVLIDNKVTFKCNNDAARAYDPKTNHWIGIQKSNLNILQENLLDYKKMYWENGSLDHEDILFFSQVLISLYPFILNILRAKFPYFYIDEFQDTNPIQSFVLNEIRKAECVIGVIGDKAQAIYGFQGAEVSLFSNFNIDSLNTHTILENHRSSNQIVNFLNSIRNDILQNPCENVEDIDVSILIGDRNNAYFKAKMVCGDESLVSLSRDNITSNAMKSEMEGNKLDKKMIERYGDLESNSDRRNFVIAFIHAVELARNFKYKEAVKKIEWLYKNQENPKKHAFSCLSVMLKQYKNYSSGVLMDFYEVLCANINVKLAKFKVGQIKGFYENTLYQEMAICVNIVEDTSSHITIHKAKGAEYKNVFVIGNKNMIDLLLKTNIENDEEQRIYYVAMSRAQRKLFLQLDSLSSTEEEKINKKYNVNIERI